VDCGCSERAGQCAQEHNNPSRDGVYIDVAFTPSAAANLTQDLNFDGTISHNVYAQPLYIESGPNGPMIIAVTESNNVYALNATTGTVIWQRNVGTPVARANLQCSNIDFTSRMAFSTSGRYACRSFKSSRGGVDAAFH
jgi:PQQ enzyme repeat